jgi:hypothetical protein
MSNTFTDRLSLRILTAAWATETGWATRGPRHVLRALTGFRTTQEQIAGAQTAAISDQQPLCIHHVRGWSKAMTMVHRCKSHELVIQSVAC